MDTDEYQAKLNALGIDRGKLATGFKDDPSAPGGAAENIGENAQKHQNSPRPAPPAVETRREPPPAAGNPVTATVRKPTSPPPVVNKPVRKCRCGVTISMASKRCSSCVRVDRRAKQAEMERKRAGRPSPPVPPADPAEEEPVVLWHVLTEERILKIAEAVIRGNGGIAHEDDIIAAVEELTRSQVSSALCTMVLNGEVKISCHNKEVLYHGPKYVGIDWDYVILSFYEPRNQNSNHLRWMRCVRRGKARPLGNLGRVVVLGRFTEVESRWLAYGGSALSQGCPLLQGMR